jgi:hypothetical protein
MAPRAVRKIKSVIQAKAAGTFEDLAADASLISGLAEVAQEQIDEYMSALDDAIRKATGFSIWGTDGLAAMKGNYETLNRKSGAVHYLLTMIGEKAEALETRTRHLHHSAASPRKALA